jgi:hypothetical protein
MFIFLLIAAAAGMPCLRMTGGRDSLLSCFSTHVDLNGDEIITEAEAFAFLPVRGYVDSIFRMCDTDKDGNLTRVDWNATLGCCHGPACIVKVCRHCELAGWTVPQN